MKVLVSYVSLVDGPILHDDTIQMLFVEYSFLGVPIQETETPCSLVKPTTPDKNIMFNFYRRMSEHLFIIRCLFATKAEHK